MGQLLHMRKVRRVGRARRSQPDRARVVLAVLCSRPMTINAPPVSTKVHLTNGLPSDTDVGVKAWPQPGPFYS